MAAPLLVKKKPGRPKKEVPVVKIVSLGIVNAPIHPDDVLELIYDKPMIFKKICKLYRAFDVSEVEMLFEPDKLKIITKDHLGKSTIYTTIEGRFLNLYYCKEQIRICVKRESLERVLNILGKNHYKITFLLKDNYRSAMYIIINDIEYDNDDSFEIDVIMRPVAAITELVDDDSAYPIKFTLSSRHFKNRMSDIRKISPTFAIQKMGNGPLNLTFDKGQRINWTGVYNDNSKINLVSTLDENSIFNVSVCIDHIKPFSNNTIGELVHIAADTRSKMSFTTHLDPKDNGWTATIKIYTELKDYHNKD
jgi:hypothetical protein